MYSWGCLAFRHWPRFVLAEFVLAYSELCEVVLDSERGVLVVASEEGGFAVALA